MDVLIISSLRAVRSLFTPGMFSVFILSILVTIASLIGFITFSSMFFGWLSAHMENHPTLAHLLPWIGSIGATLIAWILFPGIMPVIVNFFDDRIARLIERHDYPTVIQRIPSFWPEFLHDMRFSAMAIGLNILVLPLYLLPVINLFLFYVLNGYLLGREFFSMAARRHLSIADTEILRKRYARTVMTAGIILTVLATVPVINLFAPFWGIAVMVHLYHGLARTPRVEILLPNQ